MTVRGVNGDMIPRGGASQDAPPRGFYKKPRGAGLENL